MHYEEKIINVHKPAGISPFDAIKALKEKYLKLDKEYEAKILFGFNTDTYDILGIPSAKLYRHSMSIDNTKEALKKFEGEISLPLPPYSSYKIKGKPLFEWAQEGKLNEIEIPMRNTKIHSAVLLGLDKISKQKLLEKIEKKINLIRGDFRQEKILANWQEIFKNKMVHNSSDSINRVPFLTAIKLQIAKVNIKCSSGTYVRSVAHKLGQNLKTGAVLLSLKRTKVGDFNIKDSIDIECR